MVLSIVLFWGAQMAFALPKVVDIEEPIESSNYIIGEPRIITDTQLAEESSTEMAVDNGNNVGNRALSIINDNWQWVLMILLVSLLYIMFNNKRVSHS